MRVGHVVSSMRSVYSVKGEMPLLSPRAKVGSLDTADAGKVVPDAKPVTALSEKETWTSSLVKLALRSGGMVEGVCARAGERRVKSAVACWRKRRAMVIEEDSTIR